MCKRNTKSKADKASFSDIAYHQIFVKYCISILLPGGVLDFDLYTKLNSITSNLGPREASCWRSPQNPTPPGVTREMSNRAAHESQTTLFSPHSYEVCEVTLKILPVTIAKASLTGSDNNWRCARIANKPYSISTTVRGSEVILGIAASSPKNGV